MHDEMEFQALEARPDAEQDARADLGPLRDVPVELAVEIGRTRMTIGETLELRPGSVVSLDRLAGEPVDLLVNGKRIARGEVVAIDEEFGLRLTDVVSAARRLAAGSQPSAEADLAPEAPPVPEPEPEVEVELDAAIEEATAALVEEPAETPPAA
jgi:flagellar motor switch protein FliN/FliY